MMFRQILLFIAWFFGCYPSLQAQLNTINVHHLNSSGGLADGIVRSIAQDKYGYIWLGSISGLSRFNGYAVKVFQNDPREKQGIPFGQVLSVYGDKAGNLWIGFNQGLYQFDYIRSHFIPVQATQEMSIYEIMEDGSGCLVLSTSKGIVLYKPGTNRVDMLTDKIRINKQLLELRISDIELKHEKLYMATTNGIVVYDISASAARLISQPLLPFNAINKIAVSDRGTIWCTYEDGDEFVFKTDSSFRSYEILKQSFQIIAGQSNPVADIFIDSKDRLWCATGLLGLFQYDGNTRQLIQYRHDPTRFNSLSMNHFNVLFEDKNGFIWSGSEGYGVDYFHPDHRLFTTILPGEGQRISMSTYWARAFVEDRDGNLWMGWGEGLVKQKGNEVTIIRNLHSYPSVLHSNSIRCLLEDSSGNIWIGTSNGMNRWQKKTGKIEFLDEQDSLPRRFYWSMLRDSYNNIWFGSNRALHYLDARDKKIHPVSSHPVLGKLQIDGTHAIFEDSRKRLWFGANGAGLTMYDPVKNITRQWQRTIDNDSALIGNTITSITEDKNGIIWISSFIGIVSYDPATDVFKQYAGKQGLPSVKTSCLMVDEKNRLWIGSTSGLLMMDSSRSYFKQFDLQDGLPVMEFNDQTGFRLKDGRYVFPTLKGFVAFDPASYTETTSRLDCFLSSVKIYDKEPEAGINYEELKHLNLRYDQNFFSFELAALNYMNAQQTWYAYKLDGFDKDWIYTKDRMVNYTNVPGGNYTFLYKATADPNNWNVAEKKLSIRIGTVFYKTAWFWVIVAMVIVALLYWFYRNRIRQQEQVHMLQSKAQSLEKEKALVMYENLKQQLNPHFLFNSLTSLSSLIRVDQKVAGQFLDNLSKTYRYILKNRESELVPLGEEIKFAENYVRLQRTRFETGLKVNIMVDEIFYQRRIAPVTLQNMIENAIKHNIIDEDKPLVITIFTENDYVVVRNNLQMKNFVETSNKQGLINLQSLYHYLSDRAVEIYEDSQFFTVKIPLL